MPNILADNQVLESTGLEKNYSFIFETSGEHKGKTIYGKNPLAVFYSLESLDKFIEENPWLISSEDAGIAGYIGYEGGLEFGVFEEIKITESNSNDTKVSDSSYSNIIYPDPELYIDAIKTCQKYIKEGDIYQANLAHKFIVKNCHLREEDIYSRLKLLNPAPYAGYMNFGKYGIISSSPESFLKISSDGIISSSPIKGTAKINEREELLLSKKERAEHTMIVDLIRNDLGKICEIGSIKMTKDFEIKDFINLYHLISTIEGKLKSEIYNSNNIPSFTKIFMASFPGGSITGAPKFRATQIIKELESDLRGPYTGTMGYYRFKDGGEFNILIRSIIIDKISKEISFHTGAGITAASDPEAELKETYLKAQKLIEVFE